MTNVPRQTPDEQGILTRDDDDTYTIMPNVIIDDSTLTTVEKMVLLALYRRCRPTDAGHPVFPSYADMARLARISRRAAIAAIRGNKRRGGLVALGWLTATPRRTAGGEPTSNIYRLTAMPLVAAREKAARTKGQVVSGANGAPPADSQDDSEKASQKAVSEQKASVPVVNVVHYPSEPGSPELELLNQRRSKEGEGDALRASSTSSVADASQTREQAPAQTLASSEGQATGKTTARTLLDYFCASLKAATGQIYMPNWDKDGPQASTCLTEWSEADARRYIAAYCKPSVFARLWQGDTKGADRGWPVFWANRNKLPGVAAQVEGQERATEELRAVQAYYDADAEMREAIRATADAPPTQEMVDRLNAARRALKAAWDAAPQDGVAKPDSVRDDVTLAEAEDYHRRVQAKREADRRERELQPQPGSIMEQVLAEQREQAEMPPCPR